MEVVAAQARHEPPFLLAPQEGGEFRAFGDLPPRTAAADLATPAEAGPRPPPRPTRCRPRGSTACSDRCSTWAPRTAACWARALSPTSPRGWPLRQGRGGGLPRPPHAVGAAALPRDRERDAGAGGGARPGRAHARAAAVARPRAVPRGHPRGRAGRGARQRHLRHRRLRGARVAVALSRHRPAARPARLPRRGDSGRPHRARDHGHDSGHARGGSGRARGLRHGLRHRLGAGAPAGLRGAAARGAQGHHPARAPRRGGDAHPHRQARAGAREGRAAHNAASRPSRRRDERGPAARAPLHRHVQPAESEAEVGRHGHPERDQRQRRGPERCA